jgi:hypothetical protein
LFSTFLQGQRISLLSEYIRIRPSRVSRVKVLYLKHVSFRCYKVIIINPFKIYQIEKGGRCMTALNSSRYFRLIDRSPTGLYAVRVAISESSQLFYIPGCKCFDWRLDCCPVSIEKKATKQRQENTKDENIF